MANPHEDGGVSATIKFPESARYKSDNPWIVFHGSVERVRADIIDAFGFAKEADELSLSDLVLEAQSIASAQGNVASSLGGRTIGSGKSKDYAPTEEEKPSEPAKDPLLAEIEALEDLTAHRNCWADNKEALSANAEALEAWKVKGRALKEAAA